MNPLHFVFLQGMPSPFFRRVGRELAARGCTTTRINLCIGDWLFWHGPDTVNYRGSLADWPSWLGEFFARQQVTDLVLLGEQRYYHKAAVELAQSRGIRVSVTDFGYLRPDWINLERDGMSGNSRFPRDLDTILNWGERCPPADFTPRYADSARAMAMGDLLYSFANVFLGWLYPRYVRSDRRPHPILYFPAVGWRLLLAPSRHRRAQKRVRILGASRARFFLFPLQLAHDFQIVAYSPFQDLGDAIERVLESFSRHAAPDMRLVVKSHPWEPGLRDWRAHVRRLAQELGIAQRVDYLDGGDLDELIRSSQGMVTVNSTSGIRALQLGRPVKTLGAAIYDIAGLTYQGELDRYWAEARPPAACHVQAFLQTLAATTQIRGVYFAEPGLTRAVDEAVSRLYQGSVGPLSPTTVVQDENMLRGELH